VALCTMEPIASLLSRLGLERHLQTFEDEELDYALLQSMGPEMLRENLEELGLDRPAVEALAGAIFPADDDDDDGLQLEGNDDGSPPVPSGGSRSTATSSSTSTAAAGPLPQGVSIAVAPIDALPDDVTQEEIDAAEAEAQWLLNPLSMLDLSETKERLMTMLREGIEYQRLGQFANARAVYTRALGMEAPNKRMNAALYYNRSACQVRAHPCPVLSARACVHSACTRFQTPTVFSLSLSLSLSL
jgi:hypothetical protein